MLVHWASHSVDGIRFFTVVDLSGQTDVRDQEHQVHQDHVLSSAD